MFKKNLLFWSLAALISINTSNVECKAIHVASQAQFKSDVLDPQQPKVLKFFAEWCGPCKQVAPTFKKMTDKPEFSDIIFAEIDIDQNDDIATKYGVKSVPTVKLLDASGKEVDMMVGGGNFEKDLTAKINKHFRNGKADMKQEKPASAAKAKKDDMKKGNKPAAKATKGANATKTTPKAQKMM